MRCGGGGGGDGSCDAGEKNSRTWGYIRLLVCDVVIHRVKRRMRRRRS